MRASLFMLMHTDWIGEDGESGVANERRCMADKENRFSLRVLCGTILRQSHSFTAFLIRFIQ